MWYISSELPPKASSSSTVRQKWVVFFHQSVSAAGLILNPNTVELKHDNNTPCPAQKEPPNRPNLPAVEKETASWGKHVPFFYTKTGMNVIWDICWPLGFGTTVMFSIPLAIWPSCGHICANANCALIIAPQGQWAHWTKDMAKYPKISWAIQIV